LKAATELEPENASAQQSRAIVRARQGDLEGALKEYRRALEINPREAKVHYGLGSVLEKLGQLEEAARELKEAVSLDSDFSPPYYRLSTLCFRLRRREEAELYLRRFRELKASVHYQRAAALQREKNDQGAIREYERALDAHPDLADAHAKLGALYLKAKNPERALTHALRAAELDPKPFRFANLSWAYKESGKKEEALRWIDKAIELEPGRKEFQEERQAILDSTTGDSSAKR